MRNLFQLKKHLTILDASRHLTNILKDDVTEADVLELALDGHLKVSVNFVNYVHVRRGEFTGYENGSWCLLTQKMKSTLSANHPKYDRDRHNHLSISYFPPSDNLKEWPYKKNLDAHDDLYITLNKEVTTITGTWDLLLIGNERKYIENSIQQLRNGSLVTIERLEGVFLEKDGDIYQLQEHIHKNKKQFGAMAQLKKNIAFHFKNNKINEEDAEKLLNQYMVAKQELNSDIFDDPSNGYFPAPSLPMDCTLVVRTEELQNFLKLVTESSVLDKPLATSHHTTLLTIIAALCDYSNIEHQMRGASGQISKMTDEIDASVTDETILAILKKIPEALERRMK